MSENVTAKFRVDISDLKKNIAEANRQVKLYRAELVNASAGMAKGEENADSLSKKIEAQSKIVEAEKKKLELLKEELTKYEKKLEDGEGIITDLTKRHQQAADAFGEDSEEAKKLAKQLADAQAAQERNARAADDLRVRIVNKDTAVRNAEGQVEQFSRSLDELQREEEQTGEAAQETTEGGLQAFAVALGNLASNVITAVVDKLGELVKSVIDTGMAFDSSMSNVKAIAGKVADDAIPGLVSAAEEMGLAYEKGADATETAMNIIEAKAEALGESTKFTATEVADAFGYMAMAGWKTEDMLNGIDGVLNLAAAANADLATTSDIVTDSLTAFGATAEDAGRLADIMAAASSNANTNVEMMGETFKYAAPLAGAMGYSMEDVAIATGLMANSGIKATQAGTTLRAVFTRLAKQPKEAATAMDALGISLEDGEGNMKSLMELMQDLRGSFGDLRIPQQEFTDSMAELDEALESGEMTEKEYNKEQEALITRAYGAEGAMKAQYAAMLAGANGLSGFLALVNASEEDFAGLTDAIYSSEGAAQQMAETMSDNLEGDLTKLGSAFDGFKKKLYDGVSEPLRNLVQMVTGEIMPALSGIVTGENGAAEKLGAAISGVISKALDYVLEGLPTALSVVGSLLSSLALALVESAPKLLDAAATVAQMLISGAAEAFPKLITALVGLIQQLPEFIRKNLDPMLASVSELLTAIINTILDPEILSSLINAAGELVVALADGLTGDGMTQLLEAANTLSTKLVELLVSPDFLASIAGAATQILAALVKVLVVLTPQLVMLLMQLVDGIGQVLINADWAAIGMGIVDAIINGANSVNLDDFWATWLSGFDDIKAGLQAVGEFGVFVWDEYIVKPFSKAGEFFKTEFEKAYNNVKKTFQNIGAFFSGIWNLIKTSFTSIGTKVGDAIGGAFKKAINAVLSTVERNLNMVPNAINGMLSTINQLPGVNISPIGTVSLPRLAKGGIIDRATIAQIGEAGKEAVIPLEHNKQGLRDIAHLLASEMGGGMYGGAPVQTSKTVNMTQNITCPKPLSRYDIYRQTKNMLLAVQLEG